MDKKKWLMTAGAGALILGMTATIYGLNTSLNRSELERPNEYNNRIAIAETVLKDTGLDDRFTADEVQEIFVNWGDVAGERNDPEEAVVILQITPQNAVSAVYTPNGDDFHYIGSTGEYFLVQNVYFVPYRGSVNDMILIEEQANQKVGAQEKSSFLRGYIFEDGAFQEIISIPQNIEAYWNMRWEPGKENEDNLWKKISQKTEPIWNETNYPVLNLMHYQTYAVSDEDTEMIPEEDTFQVQKERAITEQFIWSNEWNRMIMGEKIEKATGQKVAVIEDLANSPYALLDEYGDNVNKVRIQRKDGTKAIVYKDALEDLQPTGQPAAKQVCTTAKKDT